MEKSPVILLDRRSNMEY